MDRLVTFGISNQIIQIYECDLVMIVTRELRTLGIPANLKGYALIREALVMAVEDMTILDSAVKVLYPTIAKKYQTTPSRVERVIRYAIETSMLRGNPITLNDMFGHTISVAKGKLTNSEYLATVADAIRLQLYSNRCKF